MYKGRRRKKEKNTKIRLRVTSLNRRMRDRVFISCVIDAIFGVVEWRNWIVNSIRKHQFALYISLSLIDSRRYLRNAWNRNAMCRECIVTSTFSVAFVFSFTIFSIFPLFLWNIKMPIIWVHISHYFFCIFRLLSIDI